MNLKLRLCGLLIAGAGAAATAAHGQDLTITNGRIIDGTGRVIDRGSVVIRGGKVADRKSTRLNSSHT